VTGRKLHGKIVADGKAARAILGAWRHGFKGAEDVAMQFDSFAANAGPWAILLTWAAWILLFGVPAAWLAGQIGVSQSARRIGVFTPLLTVFAAVMILVRLQRWPFW